MTSALRDAIEEYRRAARLQLDLLDQLVDCATRQRDASRVRDAVALADAAATREAVLGRLVESEDAQRPRRAFLLAHLAEAGAIDGFDALRHLHRRAETRVAEVLALDAGTRAHLQQSEESRRSVAHAIEAGGITLAAYRRNLSAGTPRSTLVDKRW
jgi:hypothetical protein